MNESLVLPGNAPVGKRNQVGNGMYFFPFMEGDAVSVFDQEAVDRILIIGLDPLIQFLQKVVHFTGISVLEYGKEFVPAVASDETRTGSRKMQNTGKIPDQLVSLDMAIMLVDLVDVRQVEHDASQVLRHRPVQIFLDHNVTAEAIGDS